MTNRQGFLEKNKIDPSYHDFFTNSRIEEIENIFLNIEEHTPNKIDVFKVFQTSIQNKKIVLLGMDPYPQLGVATGRAFEVRKESWLDRGVNTSLKNILKLIYKTYVGVIPTIDDLRKEIKDNKFKILPPNELFESWEAQGVLLLNTALTVKVGEPGSHIKLWKNFTEELLEYLEEKNSNLVFFLWGTKAIKYKKNIKKLKIIEHNHPAICGNLKNPKDFMNGRSFSETKEIINWLGEEV